MRIMYFFACYDKLPIQIWKMFCQNNFDSSWLGQGVVVTVQIDKK